MKFIWTKNKVTALWRLIFDSQLYKGSSVLIVLEGNVKGIKRFVSHCSPFGPLLEILN